MIASIAWPVALGLLLAAADAAPAGPGDSPVLDIDACVDVDAATVREVMELELRDIRGHDGRVPATVTAHCVGDAPEIQIELSPTTDPEDVRTVTLVPVADTAAAAARQARSRELALAVAELIRRRAAAPAPPPAPPPPAAATASEPVALAAVAPPVDQPTGRWQVGAQATVETFAGGRSFAGGDVLAAVRPGAWFLAELRAGLRWGAEQPLAAGRLQSRAGTLGAAVGVVHHPDGRALGLGLLLRAEGRLIEFEVVDATATSPRTARLAAFTIAVEPRLYVRMTRHFGLEAAAAAGFVPHGIVVRNQGVETDSVSGLALSGSLGGVATF